jgi:hypothetical protein
LIGKTLREDSMNITEEIELSMEILKNSHQIQKQITIIKKWHASDS